MPFRFRVSSPYEYTTDKRTDRQTGEQEQDCNTAY